MEPLKLTNTTPHKMALQFDICTVCGMTAEHIEDFHPYALPCPGGAPGPLEMIRLVELKRAGEDVPGVKELR